MLNLFNKYKDEKKLNEANLILYKKIIKYIENDYLSAEERDRIIRHILDKLLQAQIENKSVNELIGSNYEEYYLSAISKYRTNKSRLYKILNYIDQYFKSVIFYTIIMLLGYSIVRLNFSLSIPSYFLIAINAVSIYSSCFKNEKKKITGVYNIGKFKFPKYKYKGNSSIIKTVFMLTLIVPTFMLTPQSITFMLSSLQVKAIILFSAIIICLIKIYKITK